MRPAFSVVVFTTLIGAAQGLALALVALQAAGRGDPALAATGAATAVALALAGLGASFLHLGRPARAWRAAAMWRTSWLSREVIVLPLFVTAVAAWGWMPAAPALGVAVAALALALFVCTAMIYATIRFLPTWAHPLTLVNYTLQGAASGTTLAAALAAFVAPAQAGTLLPWALGLTLAAGAGRAAALWRNARLVPRSTLQTAIGIRHPQIRQTAMGFMGSSFNTREFFHGQGPAVLRRVQWACGVLAFALPALALALALRQAAAPTPAALLVAVFVVQYAGLLAERWAFFAEAEHPQNLYYRTAS